MRTKVVLLALLLASAFGVQAQRNAPAQPQSQLQQPVYQPPQDVIMILTTEIATISQAVQAMNMQMRAFLEKPTGPAPAQTVDDKRAKIVAGLQALAAAEQRVIYWQNFQFDLNSKLTDTRSKLAQVELDLRPQRIDRSVQFEGTTETEELRDARRQRLTADRTAYTRLIQQLQDSLDDASTNLRDAQLLARNLRRTYVPQIERDMNEP